MGCWKGGRECQTPTTKSDWSAPERRRRCFGGREAVLSRSRSRSSLGTKLGFVDWLAGECSGSHLTDLTRPDQTRPDLTDRPTDKADRGLDSFCLWVGGRTWVSALPCPAQSCVSRSRLPKPSTTTGEPPASQQPASSRLAGRQPQHHTLSLKDRERDRQERQQRWRRPASCARQSAWQHRSGMYMSRHCNSPPNPTNPTRRQAVVKIRFQPAGRG